MKERTWVFIPPPGASFQVWADGLRLSFRKDLGDAVEEYLRVYLAYEGAGRRIAPPVWRDPPPATEAGVAMWPIPLPSDVRAFVAPLTDQGGRIVVGASRHMPGSLTLTFAAGREVEIGEAIHDALDKASGRTRSTPRRAPSVLQPTHARGARHVPSPAIGPLAAKVESDQAHSAYNVQRMVTAKRIGEDFFANLAQQEGLTSSPTADTEPAPPISDESPATPHNVAPPGVAPLPRIVCTCPPAIAGTGAHVEGCPAEDIPPGMLNS
jgi:hypothetical protein